MRARLGARKVSTGVCLFAALVAAPARAEPEPSLAEEPVVAPVSRARDCTLGVEAGRKTHDTGRLEYYGGLLFTSPLGGCTGRSTEKPAESSDELPQGAAVLEGHYRELRTGDEQTEASARALGLTDPASDDATRDERARKRTFVVSPRLARDVVAAALRAAGLVRARSALDGAAARARWSALLPELRLRGARGFDETARVDYDAGTAGETRMTGRADLDLEARLTWRFSEVLFAGQEPSLLRMQHSLLEERRDVAKIVLAALVRFQRAQNAVIDAADSPEERTEAELLAAEAELELSVLTDGWFSARHVRGAPWPLWDDRAEAGQVSEPAARPSREPAAAPAAGAPGGSRGAPRAFPRSSSNAAAAASGTDPGEGPAPGVNVPRDVGRDAKQTDGPQEAR